MADDGLLVEGVGVGGGEGCACWDQGIGYSLLGGGSGPQFDACFVDTLFLNEILTGVESTLGSGLGLLIRRRVANDHEVRVGLLREGEGDVVKAALGFVVDANGATVVTSECEGAEGLRLRGHGNDGRRDDDVGGGLGGLAEIVHDVAGYGDGARA